MNKDEALKLAQEALQKIYIAPEHEEYIRVWWPACEQAITAIKEALAQPEQEPVAYSYTSRITGAQGFSHHPMPRFINSESWDIIPLYPFPPQPEPVIDRSAAVRIATALGWEPKRKPLTDEEIMEMYNEPRSDAEMLEFARAIEAAHGIKGDA